jgi:hypothetical protein
MIIHLAVGGVPLLPMTILTIVFVFVVAASIAGAAYMRLKDYDTRTGSPWLVAAVLLFIFGFWLTAYDFGNGWQQSRQVYDIVILVVLTAVSIGILVQAIVALKKRFEKYWAIPWFGFLTIGMSIWLWGGVFRVFGGTLLSTFQINYLPTASISATVFLLGVVGTVLGWVGCLIADVALQGKNRREDDQSRAANAAS